VETYLDQSAILNKLETEYKALVDLLTPLDGWQLTTPGVVGEWSIKEVLIHLTLGHRRLLMILQAAAQNAAPALPATHSSDEDIERWHQQFFQAARARPLREVWAAFQATYAQVKQVLESLNEKILQDAQRLAWLDGMALKSLIACDTYEHYEDHALAIHAWVAEAV
jgi:hypothetical protein